MNQFLNTARVGLFFILGVVVIYIVYTTLAEKDIARKTGYEVDAIFSNVNTLTVDADVRLAGVDIGSVKSVGLTNDGRGRVTLIIGDEFQIPTDSVATIAVTSLLGQNYVSIKYGNNTDYLTQGDLMETRTSAGFSEIMDQVGQLGEKLNEIADNFSGFGDSDLFTNLNDLIVENRDEIESLFENLNEVSSKLNQGEGTLGKLINDDEAYNELLATVKDIRSAASEASETLGDARGLFDSIESGEGTLGKLLSDDKIAEDLQKVVDNFVEFSEKLNSGDGTLGKLVTDDELYFQLQGLLDRAEQSLDALGDAGPVQVLGVTVSSLF